MLGSRLLSPSFHAAPQCELASGGPRPAKGCRIEEPTGPEHGMAPTLQGPPVPWAKDVLTSVLDVAEGCALPSVNPVLEPQPEPEPTSVPPVSLVPEARLGSGQEAHSPVGLEPGALLDDDYCLTYSRVYHPPSHPDHLIRPGLFHGKSDGFGPMIVMLSFHGKYARVTKIMGDFIWTLEIHLMRRIHLPDGKIFHKFYELSHVIQEIDREVIREQQQQQQQQQENGTGESEGRGGQSPAQPSVGESGAAAPEEQPIPFVLPVRVRSRLRGYPRTCRMCFYGVHIGTFDPFTYPRCFPGVVILFDENHLGFIRLDMKYFILFGRVQNTFQHAEAPSPQAFLEMLSNIQSGPSGRSSWHAL